MDTIAVKDGVAIQIWRNTSSDKVSAPGNAVLVEALPLSVAPGMLWDGAVWSLPPPPPPTAGVIKDECRKRIYAVANETAQMNMASFAAAGLFTADQMAAYVSGLQWVMTMRQKCAGVVASAEPTYADDKHWPAAPDAAKALSAQF